MQHVRHCLHVYVYYVCITSDDLSQFPFYVLVVWLPTKKLVDYNFDFSEKHLEKNKVLLTIGSYNV